MNTTQQIGKTNKMIHQCKQTQAKPTSQTSKHQHPHQEQQIALSSLLPACAPNACRASSPSQRAACGPRTRGPAPHDSIEPKEKKGRDSVEFLPCETKLPVQCMLFKPSRNAADDNWISHDTLPSTKMGCVQFSSCYGPLHARGLPSG